METKLLLLKSICLVYYRSLSSFGVTDTSQELMSKLAKHAYVHFDENSLSRERNHLAKLHAIFKWMCQQENGHVFEYNDILTRIRVATGNNDRLYELFVQNIAEVDAAEADKRVLDITSEVTLVVAKIELLELVDKGWGEVRNHDREDMDLVEWRRSYIERLESLPLEGLRRGSEVAREIDFSTLEDLEEVFELAQAQVDDRLILPFPYQGLNDFTGVQQGLRRGDWSLHCALSGRNKTGVLIDTFCGWATLRKPYLIEKGKIPTLVYVTIEDSVEEVLQKVFTVLKQRETNEPVNLRDTPFRDMAKFVREKLTENGYDIKFYHFEGGRNSEDYLQIFRDLIDKGHEIAGVVCDYVNLIGKQGIHNVVAGDEIKYLHRKLRLFFNARNITHLTVHQLSSKAKEAFSVDPVDYIRRLPGQGTYEGCRTLETEVDFCFYLDKVQHGKITWQQFQFEKHRTIGGVPEHLKYFAMKFHQYPMLNCPWDADEEESLAYERVGAMRARPKVDYNNLATSIDMGSDDDGFDDDFDF